jgi:hypothetical protein
VPPRAPACLYSARRDDRGFPSGGLLVRWFAGPLPRCPSGPPAQCSRTSAAVARGRGARSPPIPSVAVLPPFFRSEAPEEKKSVAGELHALAENAWRTGPFAFRASSRVRSDGRERRASTRTAVERFKKST